MQSYYSVTVCVFSQIASIVMAEVFAAASEYVTDGCKFVLNQRIKLQQAAI